jgi:hypothetical protein
MENCTFSRMHHFSHTTTAVRLFDNNCAIGGDQTAMSSTPLAQQRSTFAHVTVNDEIMWVY